jgi:hypothetical protein
VFFSEHQEFGRRFGLELAELHILHVAGDPIGKL